MTELTDLDLMPFGAYKGVPMQDVSCGYFHYIWTKMGCNPDKMKEPKEDAKEHAKNFWAVASYIKKNLHALKI